MLLQVFARNGLESFNPVGEQFDPNKVCVQMCVTRHDLTEFFAQHEALVQVPDPTKKHNTVAFVQKSGYMIKGRVLRAAMVGIVNNPQ
jgi:molecular chaperone GrpE